MHKRPFIIFALLLGVAVGFGLAFFLGPSAPTAEDVPMAPPTTTDLPAATASHLKNRIRMLEDEKRMLVMHVADLASNNAALQTQTADLRTQLRRRPEPAVTPTVTYDPQSRAEPRTRMPRSLRALDASGGVSTDFIKAAELTEAAQADLNAVLRKHREKLQQLELEHAQIKYASDTELVITVTPFAAEGGKVEQALLADLSNLIKPEYQTQLAQELLGTPLSSPCNFGKMTRDINIRTSTNADGKRSYTIKDSGGNGGGGAAIDMSNLTIAIGGTSSSVSTKFTTTNDGTYSKTIQTGVLPEEYRHFMPPEYP